MRMVVTTDQQFYSTFNRPLLILCFFFPHFSPIAGGSPLLKACNGFGCYFCSSMLTIIVRRLRNCWSTTNLWAGRSRWRRWRHRLGSFMTSLMENPKRWIKNHEQSLYNHSFRLSGYNLSHKPFYSRDAWTCMNKNQQLAPGTLESYSIHVIGRFGSTGDWNLRQYMKLASLTLIMVWSLESRYIAIWLCFRFQYWSWNGATESEKSLDVLERSSAADDLLTSMSKN